MRKTSKSIQRDHQTTDLRAVAVPVTPETDKSAAVAQTLMRPTVQAAVTIFDYEQLADSKHGANINALVTELTTQVNAIAGGDLRRCEAMLVAQAHTLDELFNNLARRAYRNMGGGYMDAADTYLRLALKAQSQCRTTLETLAEIKSPRSVAFVRQANIAAGPQLVNNGAPVESIKNLSATRAGESEIEQNKLLELQHGERLDVSTSGAAVAANQDLEAMGAIDRTAHSGGQADREPERV